MKLVGVTSCPTGIAHTYMAAEALEQAAKEAGHEMVVETQGSAGSDPIPQTVIDAADAVVFAHDLEVKDRQRFAGKPTVDVGVKKAVADAPGLIAQAVAMVEAAPAGAGEADGAPGTAATGLRMVGVTSCPTGIAHTYMAAEALEQAARQAGHEMVVETQGSAGGDPLDPSLIENADAVIFAHDLEVKDRQRFAGKPTVDVGVKKAVADAPGLVAQAAELARTARAGGGTAPALSTASGSSVAAPPRPVEQVGTATRIRQWLMTGVSHMIPFVAAGGILIALGFMLAQVFGGKDGAITVTQYSLTTPEKLGEAYNLVHSFNPLDGMHWAALLFLVGAASFGFLVPILSGYIAYGIADRPGLTPGIVGGAIAATLGTGFLGGIATGFIAGFVARWISGWKVHKGVRGVMPVVVIPLLSTLITGAAMILLLGRPIKWLMDSLTNGLNSMGGSNAVLLGLILGVMMGVDLGGPINKVAYTFGTTGLASVAAGVTDAPQLKIMAAVMGAGMVAPWGLALATALRPTLFSKAEQENGKACWLLGASFISEGAIPFAAADPIRIMVSSMVGSGVAGALIMAFGSGSRAPHGGLWVTPLISNPLMFLVSVVVGSVVTAALVVILKGAAGRRTGTQAHDDAQAVAASTAHA